MLNISIGGITCKFSLLFPAVLVLMLYFDPSGMVLTGLVAALLHECGHLFALCLYRHRPHMMVFSFYGMKIIPWERCMLSANQMVIVLLAGPCVNLVSAVLSVVFCAKTSFTLVHLALAAMNLLPIRPLDGGQILCVAVPRICQTRHTRWIQSVIEYSAISFLLVSGIGILCYSKYNFSILVIAIYVILCKLFDKWN